MACFWLTGLWLVGALIAQVTGDEELAFAMILPLALPPLWLPFLAMLQWIWETALRACIGSHDR